MAIQEFGGESRGNKAGFYCSIKKSREEKSLYRTLENDIQNLKNIMNSSPDATQASLVHKKLELGNKRQQKNEGLLLWSQANWHENGEKCSEYFCKLEKKNFIKKTITELIDENGQHITGVKRRPRYNKQK